MPLLSLAEVAQRTGMARSSIYRLIGEGKLSATLDHRKRKCVELTEVLRVFGPITNETTKEDIEQGTSNRSVRHSREAPDTGQDTLIALIQELEQARSELRFKAKELDLKDRELSLMQARVEELKSTHEQTTAEKNRFLEIIERQSLLLAAPKPVRPRTPAAKKATIPAKKAAIPVKKAAVPVKKAAVPATREAAVKKVTAMTRKR